MKLAAPVRIVLLLSMGFSLTMLPPAVVALIYRDGSAPAFIEGFFMLAALGLEEFQAHLPGQGRVDQRQRLVPAAWIPDFDGQIIGRMVGKKESPAQVCM